MTPPSSLRKCSSKALENFVSLSLFLHRLVPLIVSQSASPYGCPRRYLVSLLPVLPSIRPAAHLEVGKPSTVISLLVVRLERDCLGVAHNCLLVVVLVSIRDASVIPRHCEPGIGLNGSVVVLDGIVDPAKDTESRATVGVCFRQFLVDFDGLGEVGHCSTQILGMPVSATATQIRERTARVQLDCSCVIGDSLVVIAQAGQLPTIRTKGNQWAVLDSNQ